MILFYAQMRPYTTSDLHRSRGATGAPTPFMFVPHPLYKCADIHSTQKKYPCVGVRRSDVSTPSATRGIVGMHFCCAFS